MITLTQDLESLNVGRLKRFATCWEIERADGVIFRFTDHDRKIDCFDQFDDTTETYTPVGGFDTTAKQKQEDLKSQNLELVGIISTGVITNQELRGGRYDNAKITERLIDWKYPFVGIFLKNVYFLRDIKFSGEHWEGKIEGLTKFLQHQKGKRFTRSCRHTLGDTFCQVDLTIPGDGNAENGTVTDVTSTGFNDRLIFEVSGLTKADDFFNLGRIRWQTGLNTLLINEVKDWTLASDTVELILQSSFDIQVGDTFIIEAGCRRNADDCKNKFDNFPQFGGFPQIPGPDAAINIPKDRA